MVSELEYPMELDQTIGLKVVFQCQSIRAGYQLDVRVDELAVCIDLPLARTWVPSQE